MIGVMLVMIAGGIGLAQAASDPKQVTLRWLRLGGIIAVTLTAVAAVILQMTDAKDFSKAFWGMLALVGCAFVVQLMTVQLAKRNAQRVAAALGYLLACVTVIVALYPQVRQFSGQVDLFLAVPVAVGLVGGFVMTMLFGHAYLTAQTELTQTPFKRLVIMLAGLLLLRATISLGFGLYPFITSDEQTATMWDTVMLTARYLAGIAIPIVFTYMIYDCVKRRANQSATGIIYVTAVLVMIGEGIVLGLIGTNGRVF